MKRLPRTLDAIEVRVLGCLLEKEQATPDYYPMTVNAVLQACNQKTNRHPVMELTPPEVQDALDRLFNEDVFAWRSCAPAGPPSGSRTSTGAGTSRRRRRPS